MLFYQKFHFFFFFGGNKVYYNWFKANVSVSTISECTLKSDSKSPALLNGFD